MSKSEVSGQSLCISSKQKIQELSFPQKKKREIKQHWINKLFVEPADGSDGVAHGSHGHVGEVLGHDYLPVAVRVCVAVALVQVALACEEIQEKEN